MKKALKSISKSMKVLAKCQIRNNAMYADAITHSWENLQINRDNLTHAKNANRIMFMRFELEHQPFISVLEGLIALIPADLGRQEPVDEAKRIIRLMKPVQEKP